jgi:non-ribosomal peptide synthetase component F
MDEMKTFERKPNILFPKEMVEGSIVARFEQQADLYPDKVAVKCQTRSLTYRELDSAANLVAQAILASQVDQSQTVGMLFDHDVFAVVAILGILKTGKAYIPLDPTFPLARLKYMLEDSQAGLILANNKSFPVAVDLVLNPDKIINIDELNPDIASDDLSRSISPDDLAYILYSSGSTGQPKGIVQNHRNVLHHVWDHTTIYHLGVNEKQGLVLSFSFAASVSEIFGAILNGATLCLYDIKQGGLNGLASWLADEEITVIKIPISLFRIFLSVLSGGEQFPKLRLVILGGDTLYRKDLINFRKYFSPDCVSWLIGSPRLKRIP